MNRLRSLARRWIRPKPLAVSTDSASSTTELTALREEFAALQADHSALVRRLARLEELLTENGTLPRS